MKNEIHRAVDIGKTWRIHIRLMGQCKYVNTVYKHHPRSCRYRGAFIAPSPTDHDNILIVKSSLRHWKQFPNFFIAPLPKTVSNK
jgi:hypothetical protein